LEDASTSAAPVAQTCVKNTLKSRNLFSEEKHSVNDQHDVPALPPEKYLKHARKKANIHICKYLDEELYHSFKGQYKDIAR